MPNKCINKKKRHFMYFRVIYYKHTISCKYRKVKLMRNIAQYCCILLQFNHYYDILENIEVYAK